MRLIFLLWARAQLRLGLALLDVGTWLVERSAVSLERVRSGNVRVDWLMLAAILLAVGVLFFAPRVATATAVVDQVVEGWLTWR